MPQSAIVRIMQDLTPYAMRADFLRITRSEPRCQRRNQSQLIPLPHPRDISIRPNQYGRGSSHRPDCRKLPRTIVFCVDQPNTHCHGVMPMSPGSRKLISTARASCSNVNTRITPSAVPTSRCGIRRPSNGCPCPGRNEDRAQTSQRPFVCEPRPCRETRT